MPPTLIDSEMPTGPPAAAVPGGDGLSDVQSTWAAVAVSLRATMAPGLVGPGRHEPAEAGQLRLPALGIGGQLLELGQVLAEPVLLGAGGGQVLG